VRALTIEPNTEDAKRLGITQRTKGYFPDYGDETFLKAQDEYNTLFMKEIIGRGVMAKLRLSDGTSAETGEQKYRALQERKLTGAHFTELMNNILSLTQYTEEERAVFTSIG
jgi:hypothetical protein